MIRRGHFKTKKTSVTGAKLNRSNDKIDNIRGRSNVKIQDSFNEFIQNMSVN